MSRIVKCVAIAAWMCASSQLMGAECLVETVSGLPEGVDESIAKQLEPKHLKLSMGDVEFFELWTTKSWTPGSPATDVKPAAAASEDAPAEDDAAANAAPVEYPIQPGSLVGVLSLASPAFDLRQQEIPAGTYTLRYAVQPTFEAHRDTHDTRDFLLLISPETDTSPETISDADQLIGWSADSVGAPHPAFLPLVKPKADNKGPLRPDPRDPEGFVLRLEGKTPEGKAVPMELVVLIPVDAF